MSAKVAHPITKKRAELFEAMTPKTRELAQAIDEKIGRQNLSSVIGSYDVGAMIVEARDNEAEYGPDAVAQIAAYLHFQGRENAFYRLASFAETFPDREYVKAQSQRGLANGAPLTVSHWTALAQLRTTKAREDMLKRARDHSFSAAELELEIKAVGRHDKKNLRTSTGRPQSVPNSPVAAMQKLIGQAVSLVNYETAFQGSVFEKLEELAPDRVTPELIAKLDEAAGKVTQVADAAAGLAASFGKARERLVAVQEAQPAAEEAKTSKAKVKEAVKAKPAKEAKPEKGKLAKEAKGKQPETAGRVEKPGKDKSGKDKAGKGKPRRPEPSRL